MGGMNVLFALCLALGIFFVFGNLMSRRSRRRQSYSDLTADSYSGDPSSTSGDDGGDGDSFSFSQSPSHSYSFSTDSGFDSSGSDGSMGDGGGGDGGGSDN